jgi:protein pelota
MIKEED